MAFHSHVTGDNTAAIEDLMLRYIGTVDDLGPFSPAEKLNKALLVTFPNLRG